MTALAEARETLVAGGLRRVLLVGAGAPVTRLADLLGERGFAIERVIDAAEAIRRMESRPDPAVIASFVGDEDPALSALVENLHRFSPASRLYLEAAGVSDLLRGDTPLAARLPRSASADDLVAAIEAAARRIPADPPAPELPIATDPKMQALLAQAARAAASSSTILIEGESGCGKEVVARAVHRLSPRRDGPFVAINCAALPEGLVESELFGHERGAFTGATGSRLGRFEAANGGTLLLDEVGEMPLALQAKLLRVLQERSVERVGGARAIHFDVRVIVTTNRNLETEVTRGNFRLDLFYRLAVLRLTIPPLRERPLDVPALAQAFLPPGRRFSPAALHALGRHSWPGNVRELANVVERAAVLVEDEVIDAAQLQLAPPGVEYRPIAPRGTLEEVEQLCIRAALEECAGNRTHAARLLGISIRTLRNRLADYRKAGITMPGERRS